MNYAKRGPYRTHPLEATKSMDERPNLVYPIPGPNGDIWPARQWLWSKERVLTAVEAGELEFVSGRDGKTTVHSKQYLRDSDGIQRRGKPFSIIDDVFTQHGTNEMIELFGDAKIFPFPKPVALVRKLVDALAPNAGDIILDFFAGSASTAHAVMEQNALDSLERPWVLVQLPESAAAGSPAAKAGYSSIPQISRERIKRAAVKITDGLELANLDVGFRALRIDSSSVVETQSVPDDLVQASLASLAGTVKSDRSAEDLLFHVLLDQGLDLSWPILVEQIDGREVFIVGENDLVACFADELTDSVIRAIAGREPGAAVFKDAGFVDDAARINASQIFTELAPDAVLKVV